MKAVGGLESILDVDLIGVGQRSLLLLLLLHDGIIYTFYIYSACEVIRLEQFENGTFSCLQLMNNTFRQVLSKIQLLLDTITDE